MSITAKEDVVLTKEDVAESKEMSFGARRLQFAHKFTGGETSLDLNSLVLPSELSPMVNPSPADFAGAHLSVFKKNVRLSLSRGIELKPYAHYLVTGDNRIQFVNDLYNSGGAQAGEILFGEIDLVPANSIVVADARRFTKTIEVAVGQTLVNLGNEFKVNENAADQIGAMSVFRNGQLILRNVGNATAGISADGNYQEIDSGNGYGTQIQLNVAPVGQADSISVVYGLQIGSGDLNLWGAIEQLQGAQLKIAQDLALALDNPLSNYLSASPTTLERRLFGDTILTILSRLNNPTYDQFHMVEYTGATLSGTRILPQVLNRQIGSGAFDLTQVISNGRFRVVKAGFYYFHAKSQMTALGTMSIARQDSNGLNGNNANVLESVVPVTAQEFGLGWLGYLDANEVIAFNANTTVSANDARQMWTGCFLGTKAPVSI